MNEQNDANLHGLVHTLVMVHTSPKQTKSGIFRFKARSETLYVYI